MPIAIEQFLGTIGYEGLRTAVGLINAIAWIEDISKLE
jgi:hypothetical protein